jgi:hypothetical protein
MHYAKRKGEKNSLNGGVKMTDCKKLNELIQGSDYPINVIASKAGMTVQSLHNKRTGKREFTIKEMIALCKVLDINKTEREQIFLR